MKRIYIAAPWARREEAREARLYFELEGFDVTSRWLDVDELKCSPVKEAQNDIEDVLTSDAVVVLNLQKSEGKAFEQGLAFMANIPIYVIGDKEQPLHIFQRLLPTDRHSGFLFFPDIYALITALRTFL